MELDPLYSRNETFPYQRSVTTPSRRHDREHSYHADQHLLSPMLGRNTNTYIETQFSQVPSDDTLLGKPAAKKIFSIKDALTLGYLPYVCQLRSSPSPVKAFPGTWGSEHTS